MKFLEALSQQGEHKTFSPENVRGWLLSEDPIQMWPNNSG
jgi:hypothetical protein